MKRLVALVVLITSALLVTAQAAMADHDPDTKVCARAGSEHGAVAHRQIRMTHGGREYEMGLCIVHDQELLDHYWAVTFKFDDSGATQPDGDPVLKNQGNVATAIETDWMRFEDASDGSLYKRCDQESGDPDENGENDGGGCNNGDWTIDHGGQGPCANLRDITNHPKAFGNEGCLGSVENGPFSVDFSMTDKKKGGASDYGARSISVRWDDGNVSPWQLEAIQYIP